MAVNSLPVANRQAVQSPGASPLHTASQRFSKSLSSNASTSFSNTLTELQSGKSAPAARTEPAAARQNLVATVSNSRIVALPSTSAGAGSAGGNATSMTKEQARQILVSGQGDVVTANQVYYGTPSGSNSADALAPGSLASAGPLAPYVPKQSASADPNVYGTGSYIQELNFSTYQQNANFENARRYQNYMTSFQNWQTNGSQGAPPQPPQYETVDRAGFDKWWGQYQATIGTGAEAPDISMFVTNAPDYGNGYYGMPGTSQVATLYNPTGPASTAQQQAAANAPAKTSGNGFA